MSFRRILRLIKDFATTFDAAFYRREANSMVSHLFPRAHFVIQGQRAGNKPHLNFNILEYSKTFPRTPIKSQFPFFHYLLTTSSINPGTSWDNYYLQVFPEANGYPRSLLLHAELHNKFANSILAQSNLVNLKTLEKVLTLSFLMKEDYSHESNELYEVSVNSCAKVTLVDADNSKPVPFVIKRQHHEKNENCNKSASISIAKNSFHFIIHTNTLIDLREITNIIYTSDEADLGQAIADLQSTIDDRARFIANLVSVDDFNSSNISFENQELSNLDLLQMAKVRVKSVVRQFKSPERILLVSHEDSWTGAPIILKQIATELSNAGKTVEVLTVLKNSDESVFTNLQNISLHLIEDGQQIKSEKRRVVNWFLTKSGEETARKIVTDFKPDFCIVNSLGSVDILRIIKSLDIPVALYVHEQWDFGNSNWSTMEKLHSLVEDSLSSADSVWFGSDATRKHWEGSKFPMNALTIPTIRKKDAQLQNTGPDSKLEVRKKFAIQEGAKIFLLIATFEKRKRIEDVVKAFKQLDEINTQLFLVGSLDGVYSKYIENLVFDDSRIRIFPTQTNLDDFYRAADFFVFASEEETMPLVLQEAAYFGLPRIVSMYNGFDELISSNGEAFLYQTGNIEELLGHMKVVLNNPKLAQKIALLGLEKQVERQVKISNLIFKSMLHSNRSSITLTPASWLKYD